jgi:hypothetical protein
MKSLTLLCAALSCLMLSGCVHHHGGHGAHGGKTKVVVPVPVVVEAGKSGKCPPGQAKKGNC